MRRFNGARWPEPRGDRVRLTNPTIFAGFDPTRVRWAPIPAGRDIVLTRGPDGPRVNVPHRWVYHSPDGFEWGYEGSGPAELALNILGLFVGPAEAWHYHQEFKRGSIAQLPHEGGTIPAAFIRRWILDQRAAQVSA